MQGRMEVEEILEQRAWADRNGVELGAAYVPAQALRDHELKTYRDCPIGYEDDPPTNWPLWGLVVVLLVLGLVIAGSQWAHPYRP